MQKFPLRNRCKPNNNKAFGSTDTHIRMRRYCCSSSSNPHKMPPPSDAPQRLQRICQPIPSATSLEKCQLSMEKPAVKVCNRVFNEEAENVATWNDVLSKSRRGCKQSKFLPLLPPSAVSSALEVVVVVESDIAPAEKQKPVQRITSAAEAGGKLEVLCNVTASSSNTSKNNNSDTNGNRNKDEYGYDDDDDNNRRSRLDLEQQQQENHQSKTQAEAAIMSAAASAREFITFERLRLGDQINFLLFDPYRTLKFLITELKSRLKTVVPDDINVQKILVEIQQTIKRIQIPNNASEPLLQPVAKQMAAINSKTTTTNSTEEPPMTRPTSAKAVPVSTVEAAVKYILPPKERCHVIKNDPLRNDARKVNSSCQTIASQLENVYACQMWENHQVNHQTVGTVGCNQNRINEKNSNADDGMMHQDILYSTGAYQERSKDHRKDTEVRESFSCKSLQDQDNDVEILKIKNDPFSRDTQRIIAQLETELLNFQRELQRTSSSSLSVPHGIRQRPLGGSTQENSKVQSKRGPWLDKKQKNPEQEDENKNEEEQEKTFQDFITDKLQLKFWKHCNRLNSSSTQTAAASAAGALSISKESQTNLKSPTQMFCHLEKEKLLLMHKFRTSEMQTIQGDLNELHVFIKDQLNGIYQSITRENQNSKYFSNDRNRRRRESTADKNKQKSRQKNFHTLQQPEKTQASKGLPPPSPLLSSSPSLTASTSSSSQRIHEGGRIPLPTELRSALPRHYKKSSSSPIPADNGNANSTKSMMKQKSSSSSASTANAKERHNISDVDKAGGKKSKNSHQQLYGQEHLFANCRAHCDGITPDTPFCSGGKKNHHFSNVDCRCRRRRSSQLDAGTQINGNSKRMMSAMATRTSTTKGDINSTSQPPRPGPAVMTHYQRHQHSTTTTTTGIAQDQIQLISSSLPAPAAVGAVMTAAPSYISTRTPDETSRNPDTVMNAAVKTIIKDAYATTVTAATAPKAAGHSNGIREPSHQSRNSWQRVNLKNPTGCQMKKQICGADGYECTINNNNNDNRSNYPEIHDCQKYRANSINPFCGLCWAKMHEVGADNGATGFAAATASDDSNYDDDGDDDDNRGYRYDVGAGGDGPIKGESKSLAVEGNFTCHPKKRQQQRHRHQHRREQTPRLLHCCVAQSAAFQTDLDEFKEFLDEIVLSTPRTK